MSLLEDAKKIKAPRFDKKVFDVQERIDVSVAWMKGELSVSQVSLAMDYDSVNGSVYAQLANGLRDAYKKGIIKA